MECLTYWIFTILLKEINERDYFNSSNICHVLEPASCITLAASELALLRQENSDFLKTIGPQIENDIIATCRSHIDKVAVVAEIKSVDDLAEQIQQVYQLISNKMEAFKVYSGNVQLKK